MGELERDNGMLSVYASTISRENLEVDNATCIDRLIFLSGFNPLVDYI